MALLQARPRRYSSSSVAAAVVIAVVMMLGALISPAGAAATGTLTGHVTATGGTPMDSTGVRLWQLLGTGEDTYWDTTGDSTVTDADGLYTFESLAAGTYRVEFEGDGDHLGEFYVNTDNVDGATSVPIVAGGTATVNAELSPAGHVSGTVTAAAGAHEALAGVSVRAYKFDSESDYWDPQGFGSTTADDGTYSLDALAPGTYRIGFEHDDASYLQHFYGGGTDVETAGDVAVAAGATTPNINAALVQGGHVTGKVTTGNGITPVAANVEVMEADGFGGWNDVGDANTNASGVYDVAGLPTGSYKVQFQVNAPYADEYYSNKPDPESATAVDVVEAVTTPNINGVVGLAAKVKGKITLPTGVTDVRSKNVKIVNPANGAVVAEVDDNDGIYEVAGLMAGTYRVDFARSSGPSLAAGQYYNGKAESLADPQPTNVTVASGGTALNINATIKRGGAITGTVLSPTGTPLACSVHAIDPSGHRTTRSTRASAKTGDFTVGGLSTGSYQIVVDAARMCGDGPERYYDASTPSHTSASSGDADTVAVTVGSTTAMNVELYHGEVAGPTFSGVARPVITGTTKVGYTLTSGGAATTPTADSVDRQWYRGATPIAAATGVTYKLTTADAGYEVSVRYVYHKAGYVNVTKFPTVGKKIGAYNKVRPSISGTAKVGRTLTGYRGTWYGAGYKYSYRWYRGTSPISGAIYSKYVLKSADRGKYIKLKITATKSGYPTVAAYSASRKIY